jgi:hypothetical protein
MRRYRSLIIFGLVLLLGEASAARIQGQTDSGECLVTFDVFAYQVSSDRVENIKLPNSPWRLVNALSQGLAQEFQFTNQVETTRMTDDLHEVWVTGYSPQNNPIFAVYDLDTQAWEIIPRAIHETSFFVEDLFVLADGDIWGETVSVEPAAGLAMGEVPVLSKFNENTRRFEIPENGMRISVSPEEEAYFDRPVLPSAEILYDPQGFFWIVVDFDAIYRYDPDTNRVERIANLPAVPIGDAVLAPDGRVFLLKPSDHVETTRSLFSFSEGMLLEVNLGSGNLQMVSGPDETWPIFNGMLVDSIGRLWLGSTGYREPDGTWHLIHPDPEMFFEHAGEPWWALPILMTNSSDGRLWYQKWLDSGGSNEGTAWYDPKTRQGCLFTNAAANIVEDINHRLWMVAGGNLYEYPLNSP